MSAGEEARRETVPPRRPFGAGWLGASVLLVTMGLVWGATVSLAKIAVAGGAHPIGLALWQALGGGVFLLGITLLRGRLPPLRRPAIAFYVTCGFLGSVLPSIGLFFAIEKIPAGVMSITLAAVPLVTYALSALLRIDSIRGQRMLGIGLGLGAVALLVLPGSSLPDPAMAPWVLLSVAAASCYALENIYIAMRAPAGVDPLTLTAGMLLAAALMLTPITLAFDAWVPLALPWGLVEWSVVAMFITSALAYAMFLQLVAAAGPVFASQTAYAVTLAGIFWGMLLLGERHSLWIWAALILMMAGLTLVKPRRQDG